MLNQQKARVHQLYVRLQSIDAKGKNIPMAKQLQSQFKRNEIDFESQMHHLKEKLLIVEGAFNEFSTISLENKREFEDKLRAFEQRLQFIRQNSETFIQSFEKETRTLIQKRKQTIQKQVIQNKISQETMINQYQKLRKIIRQTKKKMKNKHQEYVLKYQKIEQKVVKKCQQFKKTLKGQIAQMDQIEIQMRKICNKMREQIFDQFQTAKRKKVKKRAQVYQQIYELTKQIEVADEILMADFDFIQF